MNKAVEDLTTFRTRYGTYKYKVLPFGLCNGPASFQRYINDILFDYLDDFCTAYVDDILIYSRDPLEHEAQVKKVLQRLREAGLQADIKKSEFSVTSTKFLGFIISTTGVTMDPEKVSVVKNWAIPTTVKGVQSFLGFCNFYRKFLKCYGRVVRPLTNLTKKGHWHQLGAQEIEAFDRAKALVLSECVLAHYSPNRETRMETDASDGVVAGVLTQLQDDGEWKPVAYFSKTLSEEEMRYEIHDKEMLGVIRGLQEWRSQLIGLQAIPFLAITDHRALEYFTTKRLLNARQARWADQLAEFHLRITYRPGAANVVADALTRKHGELKTQKEKDINARTQVLIKPEIAIAALDPNEEPNPRPQEKTAYEIVDAILKANREDEDLKLFRDQAETEQKGWRIEEGLLTRFGKLFVSEKDNLRTLLIKQAHDPKAAAHPGIMKTRKLLD